MDLLFPPGIVEIVDNIFSYPYLRFVLKLFHRIGELVDW